MLFVAWFCVTPTGRRLALHAQGWAVLFLLIVSSSQAATAKPAVSQQAGSRVIRMGVLEDNPPFSYLDNSGRIDGFAVDVIAAIEPIMGMHLERVSGPTTKINGAFMAGELDMLQTYASAPEREVYADFSVPYLMMSGAIIVRRGETGIQKLADLHGRRVLVHRGSVGEAVLRGAGLADTIVFADSVGDAMRRLAAGEADATLASRLTALATIDQFKLHNIAPVGDPVPGYRVWYCFAVREGDKELLSWLNEGLAILQRTGEFDRIYTKWFGHVAPAGYTREQITLAIAAGLAVAFAVAVWAAVRQRNLRKRIARQSAQLSKSEEKFAKAFHASLHSLIISELDSGRFVEVNAGFEQIFGYTRAEVVGHTVFEIGLWRDSAERAEVARVLREQGSVRAKEATFLGKGGRPVTLMFSCELIDVDGKACVLSAGTDVTAIRHAELERDRLETQLRQTQKLEAIGTLASGIAHDFNNLLTAINGNAELARMDLPADHPARSSIDNVVQAAERAGTLTRQILTFSRRTEPKLELFPVNAVIQEIVQLVQSTARSNVEVRYNQKQPTPPIQGDPAQVHQVLLNLCTNAIYAMRDKPGTLTLSEDLFILTPELQIQHPELRPGKFIDIAVRDQGCGMAPEVARRVFEPFFTTKPAGEGTGLGLSVVYGIMQQHGGTVTVYSRPGEGTVFHLYFPVVTEPASPAAAGFGPSPIERGRGQRILFLDDEPVITRTFQQLLTKLAYQVIGFSNSREALAELTRIPAAYDLIVTDMAMPGMNGIEFANHIRRLRPDLPIAFITGFAAESEISAARALGRTELVEKPLTTDSLGRVIARLLAGAGR